MKRIIGAIIFTSLSFYPYLARADSVSSINLRQTSLLQANTNPPIPDISNWTVVNTLRVDLRISDDVVAYIGLEIEYNNPADPREFVQVTRRHIPLILSRPRQSNRRLLTETANVFYNQQEERSRLNENSDKSDPIAYIRWQTRRDPNTGRDALDGDVDIWFMPPDGDWRFVKNEKKVVEFLTENVGNGKPHNIFSGIKYQIGDIYHIIRVDRNDLIRLFQGEEK